MANNEQQQYPSSYPNQQQQQYGVQYNAQLMAPNPASSNIVFVGMPTPIVCAQCHQVSTK